MRREKLRIHRSLKVRSSKGESAEKALFDRGASFTDVRKDIAEKIVHILPTEVRGLLRLIGRRRCSATHNFNRA